MAEVWDPVVEFRADFSGTQAAGEEKVASVYSTSPDEVLEVFKIELIPPVDTTANVVKKLRYVTLVINGKEYDTIRINSVMAPLEHPNNAGVAVDLGVPILHTPILRQLPSVVDITCPKVARGQSLAVKTVADESITQPYSVILKCARVKGRSKLMEVVGPYAGSARIELDGDLYIKDVPFPSLETFDELPGGLAQSKPQILPWVTYARNVKATTVNQWYDFEYDSGVKYQWMDLSFNLADKSEAYLVKALGVIPHANSKALRLFIDGRITNPEFTTKPLPDENFFYPPMYYDTNVNAAMKRAGPVFLKKPFLFHGVKGGIQVIDNGTSISADGVEVMVWGTKFILK